MTTAPARLESPALLWTAVHRAFFVLFASGPLIHLYLASRNPGAYTHFADTALFDWVRTAWRDVFMAHPSLWAIAVAAGELLVTILLLTTRRWGYLAVVTFHLALLFFGWGFWLWAVPALLFAVPALVHEIRTPTP